jgi:MFS family permease
VFGIAAGFITVIFFAIWSQAFGRVQLGRIQGAAQMLTVFASAIGPLLFAKCHAAAGSYAPLLYTLAPAVLLMGVVAWWTKVIPADHPYRHDDHPPEI